MNTDDTSGVKGDVSDVERSHGLTESERDALKHDDELDGASEEAAAEAAKAEQEQAEAAAAEQAAAEAAKAEVPTGPELLAVPEAPKDFDAERKAIQADIRATNRAYEDGDIADEDERDAKLAELDDKLNALNDEKTEYLAEKRYAERENTRRTEAAQANAQTAEQAKAAEFNEAVVEFTAANEKAMNNAAFQAAMQNAINHIDAQTGYKLAAKDLIARAAKDCYDLYPALKTADNSAAKKAAALAERNPQADIPSTLSGASRAGAESAGGKYDDLDSGSIQDMERAVAGMTPEARDKFLREVDADLD